MIAIGACLVFMGAILPFAMVMKWIPSTLFLNFLAVLGSLAGMVIGLYGAFTHARRGERR